MASSESERPPLGDDDIQSSWTGGESASDATVQPPVDIGDSGADNDPTDPVDADAGDAGGDPVDEDTTDHHGTGDPATPSYGDTGDTTDR
jgi:hypothetical protein